MRHIQDDLEREWEGNGGLGGTRWNPHLGSVLLWQEEVGPTLFTPRPGTVPQKLHIHLMGETGLAEADFLQITKERKAMMKVNMMRV